jgi:hypothetical protein
VARWPETPDRSLARLSPYLQDERRTAQYDNPAQSNAEASGAGIYNVLDGEPAPARTR